MRFAPEGTAVDASIPTVPTEPTEIVHRPPPGTIARGVWEAPPWAFFTAGAVVLVAAALYLAFRLRRVRRATKR